VSRRDKRTRADEWALTAAFALLPALALAAGSLAIRGHHTGSLILGLYFAALSLLLYLHSLRLKRRPHLQLRTRTIRLTVPVLIALGLALTIAVVLSNGRV
jgi:Flp pilus assembly protein TadB